MKSSSWFTPTLVSVEGAQRSEYDQEDLDAVLERTERIVSSVARIVSGIVIIGGAVVAGAYLYREAAKATSKRAALQRKTRGRRAAALTLNSWEEQLVDRVVDPEDIDVGFADIGGLTRVKRELREIAVLPMTRPGLFAGRGKLLRPPKGILLYGAPGTGKTMLAMALAKESGAAFIAINASDLMSKWFGESQSKVRAVFTLASKLSPCIVFIDEIDALCGARSAEDHTALNNMKAELMSAWDGFAVDPESARVGGGFGHGDVVVVGASNRPYDVDTAILRRMPRQFEVGLPDAWGREMILRRILRGEAVDGALGAAIAERGRSVALGAVARATEGFSGSDLKELCRAAALLPVQEHVQLCRIQRAARSFVQRVAFTQRRSAGRDRWRDRGRDRGVLRDAAREVVVRPMAERDLIAACRLVRATGAAAAAYGQQSGSGTSVEQQQRAAAGAGESAAAAAALLMMLQQQMVLAQQHGSDRARV